MKIDIFNHVMPMPYLDMMKQHSKDQGMLKRMSNLRMLWDIEARVKMLDEKFPDVQQVLTLSLPSPELVGGPELSPELARIANDGMAGMMAKWPKKFPAFVASLPMNDPAGLLKEARRAIRDLGAVGVQVFTNVLGKPLTAKETLPLFELMAKLDRPIWLHPARGADTPDYPAEKRSHFEIWWTFGWPYETSAAMAHIVFAGLFDRYPELKIITHHMGGMVPYFEGRVGPGWDQLGKRTSDVDYGKLLRRLKKRPLDYFRMFYADTALMGAWEATKCGLAFFGPERVLFASDAPFDPEKGSMYIRTTLEIIDRLDLSPAARHAIYEGNARRLLKLA